MSSAKFLDYEVTLLLAKYGKRAVLEVLAKKLNLTPAQLDEILKDPLNGKSGSRARKNPSFKRSEAVSRRYQLLRKLRGHIRNRVFLSDLDDIKRFLEEHGRPHDDLKSYEESLQKLFKLLRELDLAELEALCQPEETFSSLGIIADAILGGKK